MIFKFFLIDHLSSNVKKIGVKKNNLRSVYTHLLHNKKKKRVLLLLAIEKKEKNTQIFRENFIKMGQNTRLILFLKEKKERKKVRLVVIGAINLSSYLKILFIQKF